jgi:hypothetical protein
MVDGMPAEVVAELVGLVPLGPDSVVVSVDAVEVEVDDEANMITVGMTYDVAEFVPVATIEVTTAAELVVVADETVLSVETPVLSVETAVDKCEDARSVVAGDVVALLPVFVLGSVSVDEG